MTFFKNVTTALPMKDALSSIVEFFFFFEKFFVQNGNGHRGKLFIGLSVFPVGYFF